jgi:hypothetical protein
VDAAGPVGRHSEQQAAHCKLTIIGGQNDRLQQASMSCTGTTKPTVRLNPKYLGTFQSKFTGVKLAASCQSQAINEAICLISICSGSLVLRDSRVSLVRDTPLNSLVCVLHE